MNERTKCIVAYIFGWLGGLIVLFGVKENTKNTKFHAAQSIVLSIAYMILVGIISLAPVAIFADAAWVVYIVFTVIGIVKANNNENPELPVIGDLTKKFFGKIIEK